MADTEILLHEVADVVISCRKDKMLETVEKAKVELPSGEIIEKRISPGINQVGVLFERGKLFLPHVMMAADAMTAGVKLLEENMPTSIQKRNSE
jgi:dimethylamine corrinoid protein